ncbi:MAG TPA: hypothetical protein VF188_06250 [Longimicrobiales bacterium]
MKRRDLAVFAVVALVVGGVGGFLTGLALPNLTAALVGIGAGALGGFVAVRLTSRGGSTRPAAPAAAAEPDTRELMARLVTINIRARTLGFPEAPLSRVETAIDLLRELVPEVNDNHPSSAVAWEVNRACTDYLPHVVGRYAALTGAQRAEREGEVASSLDALIGALERARDAVRTQKADEMSVAAKFIGARFGDASR